MEELGNLQNTLPSLQKDCHMYGASRELKLKLRDIFDDYIDFCVVIVRHMARNPVCVCIYRHVSIHSELLC
jgi:hypothetical protein